MIDDKLLRKLTKILNMEHEKGNYTDEELLQIGLSIVRFVIFVEQRHER